LGDALRSYLDGVEVTLASPSIDGDSQTVSSRLGPTEIGVRLRAYRLGGQDAEVMLVDGEETILARLPGTIRSEDLYRAAALKVQALLQRRTTTVAVLQPPLHLGERIAAPPQRQRDRLWLDAGLAWMLPSDGLDREGLRLGARLGFASRWSLGLGAYLEPPQSATRDGINLSTWEMPFWLSLGLDWHQGRWQGSFSAVGHAAIRRISAEAPGVVSSSHTTLSPRAGGALGFALPLGTGMRVDARLSLLAALVDTRYRVDGQVVWPAAQTLFMLEAGILYGVR
jgi:hypothetical protein